MGCLLEQISDTNACFEGKEVMPEFWQAEGAILAIFKNRMKHAGLKYYSPHKFRHGAIAEARKYARTPEQQKSLSQKKFKNAVMLNLYPERATDFNQLSQNINKIYHDKNINYIKELLIPLNEINIWCAWGNLIDDRSFLINCLLDIYKQLKPLNINWLHLGDLTKKCNPMHPLARGKNGFSYKLNFSKFDIESYLRNKNERF